MSDAQDRTRITGRLTLLSQEGSCRVIVDDGSGAASNKPADKASQQQKELEESRKKGYKQGLDDAQRKAAAEISSLKADLDDAQKKIPAELNKYLEELESQMREEIIALAFKAAEAIVGAEMQRSDRTMVAIRTALSPLLTTAGVRIHVNPAFFAKASQPPPGGASFVSDSKLKSGEILVDSSQGLIDGSVKARLDALKEELLKELAKEAANA